MTALLPNGKKETSDLSKSNSPTAFFFFALKEPVLIARLRRCSLGSPAWHQSQLLAFRGGGRGGRGKWAGHGARNWQMGSQRPGLGAGGGVARQMPISALYLEAFVRPPHRCTHIFLWQWGEKQKALCSVLAPAK